MAHNLPQPRHELESLLSLLSVAMSWQDWATKAASVPWCGPSRPLRAATDCSGLGIPELALKEIADLNNSSLEVAWSCDIAFSSKKWRLTTTMHDLSRVEDGPVACVSEGFEHEGFRRLGFALYLVSLSTSCRSSRPMSQHLASGKHT
jgi:hypothetical protein